MIVSLDKLIPFVAHKDEPVRQRVAYHFLRFHSALTERQKRLLVDKILLSIGRFGFSKNVVLLELISKFILLEVQLKKLYKLFERDQAFDYYTKAKTIDLKWNIGIGKTKKNDGKHHQQILDLLKKIFFAHPFRRLRFLQHYLPVQFWKEYFEEAKRRSVFREVKLFHQGTSEDVLWSFLKKRFAYASKSDRDFHSFYFLSLLEIWSNNFSGKFRDEIKGFFLSFSSNPSSSASHKNVGEEISDDNDSKYTPLVQRKVLFHLACVKELKLRSVADVLPIFFVLDWPKKMLIEIAKTMAVFRDPDFDRQMFDIYFSPKTSSSKKSAILSYFSFVSTKISEEYLLKISEKENNPTKKLEIVIAFSHLFSTHFIPYAMDLCKRDELRYFDLHEEIILFSSILGFSNDAYFSFAGNYFKKRSRRNYYSRIPFFLRSSQFFLSKKS